MKKTLFLLLVLLSILPSRAQSDSEKQALSTAIEQELKGNILPFWLNHISDTLNGGFFGEVSSTGQGNLKAPKSAILGARILWTFSSAYRLYGIAEYKQLADRVQQYYLQHFIDPRYGGPYWTITPEGGIHDATKQTYATAFGIYALSEHFRSTGCEQSLNAAQTLFETLENHVHDHERGGYREVFSRNYSSANVKGIDGRLGPSKTMNTHIHVLEAYTNLYKVWPDARVKACLEELISILESHLYDSKTGHLILFCNDDWQNLEPVDSYGHDIETSWLLCEAAEALGDETVLARVKQQAVRMSDAALKEGMRPGGVMIYEKDEKGVNERQSWWVQAEVIVGCLNAWQITGQRKYYDQAVEIWQYIQSHFVDPKDGEWWRNLDAQGKPNKREPKASMWNCPYHNSRMAFEAVRRLAPVAVHSEVMAWSNITGIRSEGELIDFESSLRVGVPGSNIEVTGRERQQNVRYRREGQTQIVDIPLHGAHFHQEVTDVDQQHVRIRWTAVADTTLNEGAYFCMEFTPKYYANAKIELSGRQVKISAAERKLTLKFNHSVKSFVRQENGSHVLYVTFMPSLIKGKKVEAEAVLTVDGIRHHETAHIALDLQHPGARFAGFGGNFRIQNPAHDPEVIDYCLDNMRVAFGRAEFPWSSWDAGGKADSKVMASAQMAQRIKSLGMPLVISCWFPPQWALMPGQTRGRGGVAALKLDPAKKERIYESMASYLVFLKEQYGVEADYFSFNESDIGIDVLHTPQEHCDFIKEFGAVLASKHLPCKMLLGDNSDATTIDFIQPALADAEAHKYIGAVSFHSWRGCDDETLRRWRDAARSINVPLLVGEGSTDAAAWRYPAIFKESTFALYEINLYTRLCAICQPLSILQWQLTADYSMLQGEGILGDQGPLRPTQRFYNLKQLAMTPVDALALPFTVDKENVNVAAYGNLALGQCAVHVVNNGASCMGEVKGLPAQSRKAVVYVTNAHQHAEAQSLDIVDGCVKVEMPAESFITILTY